MIRIKLLQNISIKNKIIVIILTINFLIHSIGFTFITIWYIKRIKSEIQTGLVLNTKIVANNCIVPLTFGDNQQAATAISLLKNIEFIETAYLYDKNGKLIANYPDTLNTNFLESFDEPFLNELKDDFFYVKELIVFQNENYGTLYVKANSQPLKQAKKNIVLMLILLSIVLDFIAVLMAGWLQRYISFPILRLKNHFDEIAESNDFTIKISKLSNDEIGSLYDGFNNLTKQILTRSKERDKAEANYQYSQNKLELALQGGEIGVWEWDLASNLTIWDAKMEGMFGLSEGEFNQTYEAFKACLHPDDINTAENAINNAIKGIAPYDTVYRVVWKNKEVKYIRAKAMVLKDKEEKPVTMIGICIDFSNLKKAEEELKKHRDKLEVLVNERTKELELKYSELEKLNKVFVGRELRMLELKQKIKNLESIIEGNISTL